VHNKLFTILSASIAALMLATVSAQSPAPIVPASASIQAATKSDPLPATINSLRELKVANEQILKKQQATLAALDELQKAADQIKIFSKRG
jgi:hypothetical protein